MPPSSESLITDHLSQVLASTLISSAARFANFYDRADSDETDDVVDDVVDVVDVADADGLKIHQFWQHLKIRVGTSSQDRKRSVFRRLVLFILFRNCL